MIQRIQTIYLLLVAVLMVLPVFCPLLDFNDKFTTTALGVCFGGSNRFPTWGVLAFSLLPALIALTAIFLYKKRKTQMLLCRIVSVLIVLFYVTFAVYMNAAMDKLSLEIQSAQYGLLFPFVALILSLLATSRIKADEKLVKSLDRIR